MISSGVALSEALLEVRVLLGDNCVLRCPAADRPGVQYLSVKWFKVKPAPNLADRTLPVLVI